MAHPIRHSALLFALFALVGLVACGPQVQPSATPTPGVSPSEAATSDLTLRLVSDGPVLTASTLGEYGAILPGAYAVDDNGLQHLWAVGFGAQRGDQRAAHLTSPDGASWNLDPADPFDHFGLELAAPGPIPTHAAQEPDGTWVMYVWGVPVGRSDGGSLHRVTAADASGPWVADPDPVLEPGDAGSWSSIALDFPSVVTTDDGFLMLFSAAGEPNRNEGHIGIARSTDGLAWTPLDAPVISPGLCGAHDDRSVAAPRLLRTENGFLVVYAGYSTADDFVHVSAASSADGVAWTCRASAPLLSGDDVPGSDGIHTVAVASDGQRIHVLVESLVGGAGGSEIWLAELETD